MTIGQHIKLIDPLLKLKTNKIVLFGGTEVKREMIDIDRIVIEVVKFFEQKKVPNA